MRRDEGVVAGKSADINPAYRITLVQRAKKVDVEVCYLHLFPTHFFAFLLNQINICFSHIHCRLFHFLPNYTARLHDLFTTEGDDWRVSNCWYRWTKISFLSNAWHMWKKQWKKEFVDSYVGVKGWMTMVATLWPNKTWTLCYLCRQL